MNPLSPGTQVSLRRYWLRINFVARRWFSAVQIERAIRFCVRLAAGVPTFMLLTSCWYGLTERYVHEPTEELRQILVDSPGKLEKYMRDASAASAIDGNLFMLPIFASFGDGYAEQDRSAYLMLLAEYPTSVRIESLKVTNRDTGYSLDMDIDRLIDIQSRVVPTDYYRSGITLLSSSNSARFINANKLHVEVWYRLRDGARTRAEFEVRRVRIREWKSIKA